LTVYLATSAERARDTGQNELGEDEENENGMESSSSSLSKKGFGETMMTLWNHSEETQANKTLLRRVLMKWIRQITHADESEGDRKDYTEQKNAIQKRNEILANQKKPWNTGPRKRARIPEKAWFDFHVEPAKRDVNPERGDRILGVGRNAAIEAKFKTLTRGKSNVDMRPSVTGRSTQR